MTNVIGSALDCVKPNDIADLTALGSIHTVFVLNDAIVTGCNVLGHNDLCSNMEVLFDTFSRKSITF